MFEIRIRTAAGADLPGVRQCLMEAFEPYRSDYTAAMFENTVPSIASLEQRASDMTIWVATSSDRIVGTIAASGNARAGHLRGMAVLSEFHGRGVAGRLLQIAEDELRRMGCVRVTLDTTAPLLRAMAFYEKHGYRRSGVRHPMLGMELIEFQKTL